MGSEIDRSYFERKERMLKRRAEFAKRQLRPLDLPFANYEEAEEYWTGAFKAKIKDIERALSHQVAARDFMSQLVKLYSITADQRFRDAMTALDESGLVQFGEWVERPAILDGLTVEECIKATIFVRVEQDLERGMSRRLAFASWAAKMHVDGNSFSAAARWVERVWREYRDLGGLDNSD